MKKTESNPNIELKKSPEVRKDKQFRIVHKTNITASKGPKFLNRIQLPKNSQIVSKAGRFSTSQSPAKTKSQLSWERNNWWSIREVMKNCNMKSSDTLNPVIESYSPYKDMTKIKSGEEKPSIGEIDELLIGSCSQLNQQVTLLPLKSNKSNNSWNELHSKESIFSMVNK
jgi:hypothetical protein